MVRILRIEASDFLSFEDFDLALAIDGVNVIVGPNGSGKSNVRRALELAGKGLMLAAETSPATIVAVDEFAEAARLRSESGAFSVAVTITLNDPNERAMVLRFVRAALLTRNADSAAPAPLSVERLVQAIPEEELEPLFTGKLVVTRRPRVPATWDVSYEFQRGGETYTIVLRGGRANSIVVGDYRKATTSAIDRSLVNLVNDALANEAPWRVDALLPNPGEARELATATVSLDTEGPTLREFHQTFGVATNDRRIYGLSLPLSRIFQSALVMLGDTRVSLRRQVGAAELLSDPSYPAASTGSALLRLKTGTLEARRRFEDVSAAFKRLTGNALDVRLSPAPTVTGPGSRGEDEDLTFLVDPVVVTDGAELPVHLMGTGIGELLRVLLAATSPPECVVFLDEPAANLHPRLQQAFLGVAQRGSNQTILVTHSPYMIPLSAPQDLANVVRLSLEQHRTVARRVAEVVDEDELRRLHRMLTPADVRALLFASGVILTEGETDRGVLEVWLDQLEVAAETGIPGSTNVAIFAVGGDLGFGAHVRLLRTLGIPWVVVADRPVLVRESNSLAKQLGVPPVEADPKTDPGAWKAEWRKHDVFTFSDGRTEEIEEYFATLDADTWAKAGRVFPEKSVRKGRFFGENTSCPPEVAQMLEALLSRLDRAASPTGDR